MATIRFAVGLFLLLCLLVSISPLTPAVADPDEVMWSRVSIPTEGKVGNRVLANGSDAAHLTMAIDGALYAYIKGLTYTLYKSTDEGRSWSYTGEVTDAIADIACSSLDADIIYITDGSYVYRSDNAGASFSKVADTTLPALDDNESITCLDVGYNASDDPYVFIATADTDNGDFGGVYYIPESDPGAEWTDLQAGSYDVYSIAGSPEFKGDSQVIAIVTDETHTYVINNYYGVVGDWTSGVELLEGDVTPFTITAASDIRFPSDFDETYKLFIGVVGAGGDVYQVTSGAASDLNADTDIISLDVVGEAGNTQLLAGAAGSAQIYLSTNGGGNWVGSAKPPTGGSKTYVLMAPDFTSSGKAYAATSGIESAFSCTTDGGITWNQLSLVDTEIGNIIDLAPSPNYSQDNTLFMLTLDSEHSLWRSLNSPIWERVFTTTLADVDSINLVELSPQYGSVSQVVFLAGISNGNPAIWKSTDNGQNFTCRSAPFPVDIWAVVNDNTVFVGSHDGANGVVYYTTDGGSSYSTPSVLGDFPLSSIALSPNYEQDETILIGSTDGWVYWSNDNGASFEPLPPDATSPPLTDNISVAFDPRFSSNSTVYAASDTPDSDIYRFIIGKSNNWQGIDATLPRSIPNPSYIVQLLVSANNTLYATNSQPVNTASKEGGMERCLNPSYSLGPTFETVTRGLDDGATLAGLWLSGNKLWSVDTANTRLMTFTDSLVVPVTLTSPPDQASGIDTRNVNLDWRSASGATKYEWQLDYDTDFSSVPFEGDTQASSVRLPEQLKLATTYYWRVRVSEPLLSPWSATGSFTTSLGSSVIAPNLRSPGAGAKSVGLRPIFQWSAIAGADSYELLVSTDVSFVNLIIKKTLPATAWQSDTSLDHDTTYYWKVRATGSSSYSAWSAVSAFTTRSSSELTPPSSSSPPSSPAIESLSSPSTAPELYSPDAGVSRVPLKPVFQWSAIAGADSYELLVATDASFTNPIIIKIGAYGLPATAWQSDIHLDYDTTYYWKVRATGSSSYSAWSAVSAFTTEPSPELTPSSSSSPPSSPETIPDWVKYLVGALLLTMLAILITVIILTVKVFRL